MRDHAAIRALDDAADLHEMLEQLETASGWSKPKGKNRGRGLAVGFWSSRGMPGGNSLKMNPDGTIAITTGSVDLSGSHTSLQQIASEELGVSLDKVEILTGDKARDRFSHGRIPGTRFAIPRYFWWIAWKIPFLFTLSNPSLKASTRSGEVFLLNAI